MEKRDLTLRVNYLNTIIGNVRDYNCYGCILGFFKTLTYLLEHQEEIEKLPLKGTKILGYKSNPRQKAEDERSVFFERLKEANTKDNHNRTKPGRIVSKDSIFFGNICGICPGIVSNLESSPKKQIQDAVRPVLVDFVRSFNGWFSLDWLR